MKRLKSLQQWTHCTDETPTLKAPAQGLGRGKPLMYKEAKSNADKELRGSPYMGFVFGKESEYIGFDIDVDPTISKEKEGVNKTKKIPSELLFFLIANPTHVHFSPSGHGIHIIYYLEEETRQQLDKLNLKQSASSVSKGDMFCGDWRYRKSFLVFTENLHPLSVDKIATIDFDTISELIPSIIKKREEKDEGQTIGPDNSTSNTPTVFANIPTVDQLKAILDEIPATYNHIAKRACEQLPYSQPESNYDYWVRVGSACAHHSVLLELCGRVEESCQVIEAFVEWSSKDSVGFADEQDVVDKFAGLRETTKKKLEAKEQVTTINTLYILAKASIIDFPELISMGKKGKLRPCPVSVKNIHALIKHEQLALCFDPMGGGVCFKGPEETMTKWFCQTPDYKSARPEGTSQVVPMKDMKVRFKAFMQKKYGYSITTTHASDAVNELSQHMSNENAFKDWIASTPWDGKRRFGKVCKSITVQDTYSQHSTIYSSFIRKSLQSMVGIHFWPEDAPKIPAMVVLQGPEYTFKSSWAEWLIPKHMGNYIATVGAEVMMAGGKEWEMFLSTKAVIVINECEPVFTPRYEQRVKSSVDTETVTYRGLYESRVLTRPRTALIIGTTNRSNLFTGSSGTRKVWQIPSDLCDSMLIKNSNLQQVYAEVLYGLCKYKKENPDKLIQTAWAQDEQERRQTNILNEEAKGNFGMLSILVEVFGDPRIRTFDPVVYKGKRGVVVHKGRVHAPNKKANAWTIRSLLKYLNVEYEDEKFDRVKLKYAIEEYSGRYTNTLHRTDYPFVGFSKNLKRPVFRGMLTISASERYYLTPTPLERNQEAMGGDVEEKKKAKPKKEDLR